jgi:CRISPR/Cas system CSM-associated protein Csm3 (group 7 of RAMP superfamily)
MLAINYKIEFFTYWHIGSGMTGGTYADNLVLKDQNNLPYIPGRTLKGLFREASEEISRLNSSLISPNQVEKIFGKKEGNGLEDESCAFFKDSVLSKNLADMILKNDKQDSLYQVLSSTKLDDNGLADDGSLRQLEVCVPLSLFGTIEVFDKVDTEFLNHSASWIKNLGLNRNRGLGRCKVSIL